MWISEKGLGGLEILGSRIELMIVENKPIGVVVIPEQTQACLTKSEHCVGLPLTNYGVVNYGRSVEEEFSLYIEQTEGSHIFNCRFKLFVHRKSTSQEQKAFG